MIPIPAVGRAQEIMMVIDHYMKSGEMVEAPVFTEGMISEASAIHESYPEYLARELKQKILELMIIHLILNILQILSIPMLEKSQ